MKKKPFRNTLDHVPFVWDFRRSIFSFLCMALSFVCPILLVNVGISIYDVRVAQQYHDGCEYWSSNC